MHMFVCTVLCELVAATSASSAVSNVRATGVYFALKEAVDQRTSFEPIPSSLFVNHSSARYGVAKRSLTIRGSVTNLTGNVALQNTSSMYFAAEDFRRNMGMQYAKFDVNGDRKKKVLSMDDFEGVLRNATCDEAGGIGLTFTEDVDFQQVQDEWQWVNGNEDHSVVLITETRYCDRNSTDGTTRQPWLISHVAFDNQKNHVELVGEAVSFQEAIGRAWHVRVALDDDSTLLASRDRQPARISLACNFSGVGMNLPLSLAREQISTNVGPIGMLSCDPCYTQGNMDLNIDVDGLTGAEISITMQEVEASLNLRLEIYQDLADKMTNDYELWGLVPPGSGIYIKDILDIGPTIKFLVSTGFSTPIDRDVALALGYKVTMPGPMDFTWDTTNSSEAKLTGFDPQFEMLPLGISKDVEILGSIGPKLELSLDCTVLGQGAKVGLQFAAGTLALAVTTNDTQSGRGTNAISLMPAAEDKNETSEGVNFDLKLSQGIYAFQSIGLLQEGASGTVTLASTTYDLASTYIPITGVTGLMPSIATASVNSYKPFTGNLADLPLQPVKLVAQEIVGAASELAGTVVQSLAAVVAPKLTAAIATLTSEEALIVTEAAEHVQAVPSALGNVASDVKHGLCGLFGC